MCAYLLARFETSALLGWEIRPFTPQEGREERSGKLGLNLIKKWGVQREGGAGSKQEISGCNLLAWEIGSECIHK